MDDVKKFAKAFNQPTLKATPRSNSVVGFFADALKPVQQFASNYNVPQRIPFIGGQSVADITGLTGAQGLLDDVSYGAPVVRGGSFQTAQIDPRVLDVAGLVPTVGGVLKGGGMYGKSLAKEVGRNINEGTTIGQMLDPRMNMIAYHGSPHSFDKFSMDKIGTGEGAQSYGHGLYFAESPSVAGSYVGGAGSNKAFINGIEASEILKNKIALEYLEKSGGNPSVALEFLNNELDYFTKQQPSFSVRRDIKEAMQEINSFVGADIKGSGNIYKVDISDDAIPNMLLWDNPLSEQPKAVKKAFKDFVNTPEAYELAKEFHGYKEGMKLSDLPVFKNPIGETLYKNVFRWDNKILQDKGVQGIRYLDGGSRGKGAGTMNTVVFDDSLVKILEKNGKPVGVR